jgi:hypothetical protein
LDEAREQGFPSIELEVFATARFWDDNVYAGIHQLHKRKGFHPYNPNIVLLMGLPLFRVCYEWDALSSCEPRNSSIPILLTIGQCEKIRQMTVTFPLTLKKSLVPNTMTNLAMIQTNPVRQLNRRNLDFFSHGLRCCVR